MYNYLSLPIKDFKLSAPSVISRDLNKSFEVYSYIYPYMDGLVSNCEIFYICLPNNSFTMDFDTLQKLSPGCYKELIYAMSLGKKIKIIYKTKSDNVYKEYNAKISYKSISGIRNPEIDNSKQSISVSNLIQPQTILLLNA